MLFFTPKYQHNKKIILAVFLLAVNWFGAYSQGFNVLGNSIQQPGIYFSDDSRLKQVEQELSLKIAQIIGQNRFLILIEQDQNSTRVDNSQNFLDSNSHNFSLPGLPINPWLTDQPNVSLGISNKKKYFYLFIDTSISVSLVPVFEKLILSSGYYNYKNNDEIVIETIEFPNTFSNLTFLGKNKQESVSPLLSSPNNPDINTLKTDNAVNSLMDLITSTKWILLGLFIFILIILLLLFIFQFLNRNKLESLITKRSDLAQNTNEYNKIESKVNELMKVIEDQKNHNNSINQQLEQSQLNQNKEAYSNEINHLTYNELDNILPYIQHIFENKDIPRKKEIAISISESNPGLLNYLRNVLSNQDFFELQNIIYETKFESPDTKYKMLKSFREGFLEFRMNLNQISSVLPAFSFLNQLSPSQIFQLIKLENDEINSIVLSQLPPETSVKVLKMFDRNKQSVIIQKMNNIKHLSMDFLSSVAKKLNKMALNLKELGDVSTDGLNAILSIIENLPLTEQDNYIESISKHDIQLAREIQSRLVTIGGIVYIPNNELATRLKNIETNRIAQLKMILPSDVYLHILSSFNFKEQDLIESEAQIQLNISSNDLEENLRFVLKQLNSSKS